jgi:beta-1,4-mannosyl-glycoprotein beta-1,4-N-acetylglucosaminyltransferase
MIYDGFVFFNELELLELRLHELAGVVDKFVLVEATKTFSNQPKPLVFHENRARFKQFQDQIIHVVVDDLPGGDDAWQREKFQRNCIQRGLVGCRPDDLVIISDIDEIPRATVLAQACRQWHFRDDLLSRCGHGIYNSLIGRRNFPSDKLNRSVKKRNPFVLKFELEQYWHFMNCQRVERPKCGPRLAHFRDYSSAEALRHSGSRVVKNGGWHFSYMGGAERIREKIMAYSHQERNRPEFTDLNAINERINNGAAVWDIHWRFEFVPLDDSFPQYLLQNLPAFAAWIKPVQAKNTSPSVSV